jgi:ATP-dependent protease ClpP protease subunit
VIIPNAEYRPNPGRAIYIHSVIDEQLIYKLTPTIVALQHENRKPITVFIDSPGGNIVSARSLWRLLTASDQDFSQPCHIITVATTRAASAAADLLTSGDYAIVYPQSTILYHGVRTYSETQLTVETTSELADALRLINENYAVELVRKLESRFSFHYLLLQKDFDNIRKKESNKNVSDTDCFLTIISNNLSDQAKKLFSMAKERRGRYEKLLAIIKKTNKLKTTAEKEGRQIKDLVDFEIKANKSNANWSFQNGGLTRLNVDFFVLNEHLANLESDRIDNWCIRWGRFALTDSEKAEIDAFAEVSLKNKKLIEIVRPRIEPLWTFFVALCHALQEGENELTATDAFWLGLVDEVMGEKELPCIRPIMEYQPDEQKEIAKEEPSSKTDKAS